MDQAELNLSYTKIYAPAGGIIGKKTVEVGQRLQPGEEMFAIVQTNDDLDNRQFQGDAACARCIAGSRRRFTSMRSAAISKAMSRICPGASGDRFSLLPPENATGNYVKVVQRLPVRILIDNGEDDHRLRPGMNVEATVWLNQAPVHQS